MGIDVAVTGAVRLPASYRGASKMLSESMQVFMFLLQDWLVQDIVAEGTEISEATLRKVGKQFRKISPEGVL